MAALGLIEVIGMVNAVTTLDAMLKAAQVKRVSVDKVKGGLVAVLVTGEVGAVRAAVDAGLAIAQTLGKVVSHLVIPRPAEMTKWILGPFDPEPEKDPDGEKQLKRKPDVQPEPEEEHEKQPELEKKLDAEPAPGKKQDVQLADEPKSSTETARAQAPANVVKPKAGIRTEEELSAMKVVQLRNLARELDVKEMTRQEIKFARKDELVEVILRHLGER
ncbi:MAG TPA: BMC domain-containing protein [Bacillota bacterium]|nr:BMC domain-containing protein [Bacillota bacterium]